jgi:putative transposase
MTSPLDQPVTVPDLIRQVGISELTFYRWKKQYAGLESDQVREFKQLSDENGRLKKLVAELSLDKAVSLVLRTKSADSEILCIQAVWQWSVESKRSFPRFSKATFEGVYEIFDVANSWLLQRVHQGLLKAMEREEKRKRQFGPTGHTAR